MTERYCITSPSNNRVTQTPALFFVRRRKTLGDLSFSLDLHWPIAGDFLSASWLGRDGSGHGPPGPEVMGELLNGAGPPPGPEGAGGLAPGPPEGPPALPPASSTPDVSYWLFSRRVMSLSSSSPNSPPIRDGSPTTITSFNTNILYC